MIKIEQNDAKKYILDTLVYFDKICRENNLKYVLAYGTLLGAIRHNGFIPRDDDIDIMMPLNDYKKLQELELADEYNLLCFEKNSKCGYSFGKLYNNKTLIRSKYTHDYGMGLFIDIFPAVDVNLNEKDFLKLNKKIKRYRQLSSFTTFKKFIKNDNFIKNIIKYIAYIYANMFKPSFWINKIDKLIESYSNKKGTLKVNINYFTYKCHLFDNITSHEFEGYNFYIPANYDEVLTLEYGNYMELPPIDKRVPVHGYDCFIK